MSKIYKKQPLDIVVSGITLRYSMKYNIWVNWAGTRAYRKYNDSSWNRFLQIHTDINGSKFLNVKPKTVQLDEAVADAYNPMPKDGKKYKFPKDDWEKSIPQNHQKSVLTDCLHNFVFHQ